MYQDKLVSLEQLLTIVTQQRNQSKTIVWTNGCFDILHIGHVECLAQAKSIGDVLIVGMNSDGSVRMLKGEQRPLFTESIRAKVLSAIVYVDYITVFDEPSPLKTIERLQPDYYVKGGDYTLETINQHERKVIENYGGKIRFVPLVKGVSTSRIIEQILGL